MEESLNRATRTRPYVDDQANGHPINLGTRALSILRDLLRLNTSSASNNGLPQHNPELQEWGTGPANPSPPPEERWLLVCTKFHTFGTKLSQMDVCATTSDKDLHTVLRKAYADIRSRWIRYFGIMGIKTIRFVQVCNSTLVGQLCTDS